jgi:PAS domain S-box-containing protein
MAVTVLDRSGRIIVASDRAADLFATPQRLVGQRYANLFAEEDRHRIRELIAAVLDKKQPVNRIEVGVSRPGKGVTPVVLEIHPVRSTHKGGGTIVTIVEGGPGDRADEPSLCPACIFLTETVSDGVIAADDRRMILGVNRVVTNITGYSPAELVGKPIEFLMPKGSAPISDASPRILSFRRRSASTLSNRLSAKDGREIPVVFSSRQICLEGRPLSLVVIRKSFRERMPQREARGADSLATLAENSPDIISRADRDLRLELETLSSRLIDTQDEERKRIARELHDGTAQNLFAMSMVLSRLIKEAPTSRWTPLMKECLTLCEESRKEIRTLSYILHPPMLENAGLASTLKWYVEGFSERSGIKVKLSVDFSTKRFPIEIETALFRVVQECLANIHRHSGSSTASVRLRVNRNRIVLLVRDWGKGMVIGSSRPGVGIPGMRERISHLRGHLAIETGTRGTSIVATVPLKSDCMTPVMKENREKGVRRNF